MHCNEQNEQFEVLKKQAAELVEEIQQLKEFKKTLSDALEDVKGLSKSSIIICVGL